MLGESKRLLWSMFARGPGAACGRWNRCLSIALSILSASAFAQPAPPATAPVHRFYNTAANTHFYTITEAEKLKVQQTLPAYIYEGAAFNAYPTSAATAQPVFRFYNVRTNTHFYTIDAAEKDFVAATYADYRLEGVAFFAHPSSVAGTLPVYRFYNTATRTHFYTISEAEKNAIVQSQPVFAYEGPAFHAFAAAAVSTVPPSDAARFLAQATFGAKSVAQIDALAQGGYRAWLDAQYATPAGTPHIDYLNAIRNGGDRVDEKHAYEAVWQQFLFNENQLRARVAFALSEIMVVSNIAPDQDTWALASWMDMLYRNAFGNYRTLLEDVTLHPAMGYYLNMLGNDKEDPAAGFKPNENYAREVMQLFSIGLVQLDPDGTPQRNAQGQTIPTYTQADIEEFARVYTGWSFAGGNVNDAHQFDRVAENWTQPMRAWPSHHSMGSKKLLNGVVLPAGQTPEKDLRDALDNLFNHPNVGPFIARRLIQFLVTSNPSPAYVRRVAARFNDNGQGARGDLRAVVDAILLDADARDVSVLAGTTFGKQREPVVRFVNLLRATDAKAANGRNSIWWLDNPDDHLGQSPLLAPSVFNFFSPSFTRAGSIAQAGLVAPEFQITTETQAIGSSNFFKRVIQDRTFGFADIGRLTLDFQPFVDLANQPAQLVDRLDVLFTAGGMSAVTRTALLDMLAALQAQGRSRSERVRAALLLLFVAPDYVIQK
ncbi:MAG: DUF1800 domain-containing protein [Betaproteobacteria bacterium]|nr:DUF1800 domain-containing protein [Betaproteobacteria bacterium]